LQNAYNDGTNYRYVGTAAASNYQQSSGSHIWNQAASGTAGNTISFTQAMTLDANGFFGVGTTSPASYGVITGYRASGTASYIVGVNGGGCQTAIGVAGDNESFLGTLSNNVLRLATNGVERARIDTSGNLLVSQTAVRTQDSNSFDLNKNDGCIYVNHVTGSTSGNFYAAFGIGAGNIGSITQNGTTGVLYNLTSDYRLKNNQQPLTGAKDFIMGLQPKKWQWWDGSGEGVGFVAHEFMEVAKHSGHGEKDAVDADGKPVYQSIQPSSSEVMANLVSLIQEQQVLITQLTARITALESA